MTIIEVKAELLDALGRVDKSGMDLEELAKCANILRTISEVPETASLDVLGEAMGVLRNMSAVQDFQTPVAVTPGFATVC